MLPTKPWKQGNKEEMENEIFTKSRWHLRDFSDRPSAEERAGGGRLGSLSFGPALHLGRELEEEEESSWPSAPLCPISFGPRWSSRTRAPLKQAIASGRCSPGIINHSCRFFLHSEPKCTVDYASHLYIHYQSHLISCKEGYESCHNAIIYNYSSLMLSTAGFLRLRKPRSTRVEVMRVGGNYWKTIHTDAQYDIFKLTLTNFTSYSNYTLQEFPWHPI